eukprot:7460594-Alexandrium_andersonii.AAC.1
MPEFHFALFTLSPADAPSRDCDMPKCALRRGARGRSFRFEWCRLAVWPGQLKGLACSAPLA